MRRRARVRPPARAFDVLCVNPFSASACKISVLKSALTYTSFQTVSLFDGPVTNLLSKLCILIEVVSGARLKEENALTISSLALLLVTFSAERRRGKRGSERVNGEWVFFVVDVVGVLCA